jgi:copper chaperone
MAQPTQLQFIVPDMDCQGCVSSITAAIKRLDSHAAIAADLETKHVVVGAKAEPEEILRAIEEAGFTVQAARS